MSTVGQLVVLVLGLAPALPARAAPAVQAVDHGPREHPRVALTFDACPLSSKKTAFDARIARTLVESRTPATIFMSGAWAEKHPDWAKALAAQPLFEIASHGYHHARLPGLPPEEIRADLARAQSALEVATGRRPLLFRPPYAVHDDGVLAAAAELGLTTIEYDVASGDPDPRIPRQKLVDWVVRSARPGSIVVMHINHPRFQTAAALPDIIAQLRGRGFDLVTVGALLTPERPPPAPERPLLVAAREPEPREVLLHRLAREAHARRFQLGSARRAVDSATPAALAALKEHGAPSRPAPAAEPTARPPAFAVVARGARQVRGSTLPLGDAKPKRVRLPTRPRGEARPVRQGGPTRRAA